MRDTHRERQTQAEGEAGSVQGAWGGTRFRVSRITPWAEGSAKPLSHPGCPIPGPWDHDLSGRQMLNQLSPLSSVRSSSLVEHRTFPDLVLLPYLTSLGLLERVWARCTPSYFHTCSCPAGSSSHGLSRELLFFVKSGWNPFFWDCPHP